MEIRLPIDPRGLGWNGNEGNEKANAEKYGTEDDEWEKFAH